MAIVLGIIPARGGSKGILNKNIVDVCGKPLIGWSVEAALASKNLTDIIVSSDSQNIIDMAMLHRDIGFDLRPERLAQDDTKTVDVLRYVLDKFEKETSTIVDDVILLQPTSPLRTAQDIDDAYSIYKKSKKDSLISVYNCINAHPSIMYKEKDGFLLPLLEETENVRRQDMEDVYVRNGAIYIIARSLLVSQNRVVGDEPAFYVMPRERSINIDEDYDLKISRVLLEEKKSP